MIGQTRYEVTARFSESGEASIKVHGRCDYGDRTAAVSAEVVDEKLLAQVEAIAKKAISEVREMLNQQAVSAAVEALVTANKLGEKI